MKHKTVEIPRPEWCQIGTVVRCNPTNEEFVIRGIWRSGKVYLEHLTQKSGLDTDIDFLTPVPSWEPTPGEYVAAWDDGYESFRITEYKKIVSGMFAVSAGCYEHVARITGVDCACSIEELKERTDWL